MDMSNAGGGKGDDGRGSGEVVIDASRWTQSTADWVRDW